jgi:hypothetical protein
VRDGCFLILLRLIVVALCTATMLGPGLVTAVLGALLIVGGLGLTLVDWATQW